MPSSKQRLTALIDALCAGLIERDTAVKLTLLTALAAEHVLLIGPPGTAKSELARRLHRAFRDAAYFERLLTRFSVPEELFGPLSIAALEQDRYERQTAGFLPTASIAFIDEVFKANSAILNALLTLLNEREFDNGTQRFPTPLISVIGATNEMPDDELGAAFYDRFLVRLHIEAVSPAGFAELLGLGLNESFDVPCDLPLTRDELAELSQKLDRVALSDVIREMLGELRSDLAEQQIYVSDRRWRKIVRLLKTSALTDDRDAVNIWDLWLLQFCAAARPEQQAIVARWYESRLGIHQALSPERMTRVIEAFEAQVEAEQNANDLNYDESGRLAFAEGAAASFESAVNDAKGASFAPRMTYMRRRRYGSTHVAARLRQVDAEIERIDDYLRALDARLGELREAAAHLWLDPQFAVRAVTNLTRTRDNIEVLRARAVAVRAGFAALPRLASDSGVVPEPIAV